MLETYPAVLRDNHLEWSEGSPDLPSLRQGVRVYVTFLDQREASSQVSAHGHQMASILERLAACSGTGSITDPLTWERATREDRPLPGRIDEP